MQPPRPSTPDPKTTLGQDSQHSPVRSRHPHSPSDVYLAPGTANDANLVGTCDGALVMAWAEHHGAAPATGEETSSGPATVSVNDQGTGLRFNFPGAARFRPVAWEEWLAQFEREGLVFVYQAERDDASSMPRFGGAFYRIVSAAQWGDQPLSTLVT